MACLWRLSDDHNRGRDLRNRRGRWRGTLSRKEGVAIGRRGRRCDRWSGDIRIDPQAKLPGPDGGRGERKTGKVWCDKGLGSGGKGLAEKKADGGAIDSFGVGWGRLGKHKTGVARSWNGCDDTDLKRGLTKGKRGRPLGLANYVRDRNLLRAQAFGDADGPFMTNHNAGCGGLTKDVAGCGGRGVEAIFESKAQAKTACRVSRFREGETGEWWDLDFTAMNGEAHGDKGGKQGDGEHGHSRQQDGEETLHRPD